VNGRCGLIEKMWKQQNDQKPQKKQPGSKTSCSEQA
jgi:hypothetical protein